LKHRDIEYGVEEDRPGLWRWIIYPKIEAGPANPPSTAIIRHRLIIHRLYRLKYRNNELDC
jgi:hypothetical protein